MPEVADPGRRAALRRLVDSAGGGERLADGDALALADLSPEADLEVLARAATARRDAFRGAVITYSPKVFIPLTRLCRDVCHYCTFARTPRAGEPAYLTRERVIAIARAGAAAGCHEALFTLGDRPERRYRAAREALAALGHDSTLGYLAECARAVLAETGLLPHLNPGVMDRDDLEALRPVAASMGLMLESTADRLGERGGPHFGSPDKVPAVRLATLAAAGEAAVPFTSGILIGIGETREERIGALLALRALAERHGHLQEVIVQPFRAKPGTLMAAQPDAPASELLWTVAIARLVLGPGVSVQAPPNLSPGDLVRLIGAGIDDWGGVSPVTPDHVNPEAPWPEVERLRRATEAAGKALAPRLPVYPRYALEPERWLDPALRAPVLRRRDAEGYAREDGWTAGSAEVAPPARPAGAASRAPAGAAPSGSPGPAGRGPARGQPELVGLLDRARAGEDLHESEVARLLGARGREVDAALEAADDVRRAVNGDTVTYVVTRNVNYTNVCYFGCRFCAFSKGRHAAGLRGAPYDLALEEIARRAEEAWARGATEICMQGGIHPDYTGETYLAIVRAVKEAVPDLHVHAFSPLEVWQGARTAGTDLDRYLARLRDAGLGSLPGTAAEILDDEVRAVLCPDKITTAQWLEVMERAHAAGLRSTATVMFGHVERPVHVARHLLRLRALQARTGGFTELVPLPFVAREAPIYLRGGARPGPTWREARLAHAVARLALHPHFENVQTSWVKMGPEGARACLDAGANDLGGTLMNESITRAAGAAHGEELPPAAMEALARAAGRTPRQRTTLYAPVDPERRRRAWQPAPLAPVVNTPVRERAPARRRDTRPVLVRPGLGQGS